MSRSLAAKSMPREMSREHLPMLAMMDQTVDQPSQKFKNKKEGSDASDRMTYASGMRSDKPRVFMN